MFSISLFFCFLEYNTFKERWDTKESKSFIFIFIVILCIFQFPFHNFIIATAFQDFYNTNQNVAIHYISTLYFYPLFAFFFHIFLRTITDIGISYYIRTHFTPLKIKDNIIIYIFIFIIYFIPIPYHGFILIFLSLYNVSLPVIALIINFASLPLFISQIFCQKVFLFQDYQLSFIVMILCTLIYILYSFHQRLINRNL